MLYVYSHTFRVAILPAASKQSGSGQRCRSTLSITLFFCVKPCNSVSESSILIHHGTKNYEEISNNQNLFQNFEERNAFFASKTSFLRVDDKKNAFLQI